MKKILILMLISVLTVSAFFVYKYISPQIIADISYKNMKDLCSQADPENAVNSHQDPDVNYLAQSRKVNSQTKAWIKINDTQINFPVVQSHDNSYYLNHGFNGSESPAGCPFLDYRCSNKFDDFISIIYGHNIRGGKMFASVTDFKKEEYFINHKSGILITEKNVYDISFFACLTVKSDSFLYDNTVIDVKDRERYFDQIKKQAGVYSEPEKTDLNNCSVILLSTCSYEFENARTVLAGIIYNQNA